MDFGKKVVQMFVEHRDEIIPATGLSSTSNETRFRTGEYARSPPSYRLGTGPYYRAAIIPVIASTSRTSYSAWPKEEEKSPPYYREPAIRPEKDLNVSGMNKSEGKQGREELWARGDLDEQWYPVQYVVLSLTREAVNLCVRHREMRFSKG
jgi:hypothetical protein